MYNYVLIMPICDICREKEATHCSRYPEVCMCDECMESDIV